MAVLRNLQQLWLCIGCTQDQGSQNSSIDEVGALQAPPFTEELLEGELFFWKVGPLIGFFSYSSGEPHAHVYMGSIDHIYWAMQKKKGEALRRRCVELEWIWEKI